MTINNFTGGLNREVSPNLISTTEGQIVVNVNTLKGNLVPLKDDLFYSSDVSWLNKPNFYFFNGQWIKEISGTSFTLFNNSLYYSTGSGPIKLTKDGINIYNLGIDAPTAAPIATDYENFSISIANYTTGTSAIPTGDVDYRIVGYKENTYRTFDRTFSYTGSSGIALTLANTSIFDLVYVYRLYGGKYRLVFSTSNTDSIATIVDQTYDISEYSSLSFIMGSVIARSRQYCYTFYSSVHGFESAPSPYTEEQELLGEVTLSGFQTSSNNIVDQIRLYRLGGDLTNFTLVGTYSVGSASIIDDKSDISIAENELLSTVGAIKPPDDLAHLTLYNYTLFGALESTLYFSDTGLPNSWSALNTINLPDQITGLGATQNGLLVFTRNQTFLLRGSDASNFSLILLHGSQGCVSHGTVNYINNTLIWLSLDGICISRGADITIITEGKLGKLSLTAYNSVVYDGQYFLFHSTGTYLVDFRTGTPILSELDTVFRGGHYAYFYDSLFLYKESNNTIVRYAESTNNRAMKYKTGYIVDSGITNIKAYKNIYIYCKGALTCKIFIDGVEVSSHTLTNGINDIKPPQALHRGYYAELYFEGTGEVIEIEFKTEGRQNGR